MADKVPRWVLVLALPVAVACAFMSEVWSGIKSGWLAARSEVAEAKRQWGR